MAHHKIFLFFLLVTGSLTFAMEEGIRYRKLQGPGAVSMGSKIEVDLGQNCFFCRESLSTRKGALVITYCNHLVVHAYCYDRMIKSNRRQKCHCSKPLIDYDASTLEEIEANKQNEEKNGSCIEKSVYFCARFEIFVLKELVDIIKDAHKKNISAWAYPD